MRTKHYRIRFLVALTTRGGTDGTWVDSCANEMFRPTSTLPDWKKRTFNLNKKAAGAVQRYALFWNSKRIYTPRVCKPTGPKLNGSENGFACRAATTTAKSTKTAGKENKTS